MPVKAPPMGPEWEPEPLLLPVVVRILQIPAAFAGDNANTIGLAGSRSRENQGKKGLEESHLRLPTFLFANATDCYVDRYASVREQSTRARYSESRKMAAWRL